MKKDMPLEGLRWSRDSGSALYDTPQNGRSRTGWGEIKASADGTTPATSPLSVKILQKKADAFKKLDGLKVVVSGKAKGEGGNAVTGVVLNAEKHTLKLNDIKIKLVGKVIGDFN